MTPAESFSPVAPASLQASTSASGDRPRLDPQSRRAAQGALSSCDQLRIGESATGRRRNHAVQPFKRPALHVPIVQAEREFIDVAAQMLGAGVVIDAMQAAFQDCPDALDAVRSHASAAVLASAVVDGFVVEEQADKAAVRLGFVGVQGRTGFDVGMDGRVDVRGVGGFDGLRNRATAALAHSHDGDLANRAPAHVELLRLVLIRFLPADVGFVNLDDAVENRWIVAAGFAESLEDEPGRLLRDTDLLRQLEAADALPAGHKQVHGVKPLVQLDVAALEDGPGANGEVLFTLVAAVVAAPTSRDAVAQAADRAAAAVRPEARFEVEPRRFLVREHLEQFHGADGESVIHGSGAPKICRQPRFG